MSLIRTLERIKTELQPIVNHVGRVTSASAVTNSVALIDQAIRQAGQLQSKGCSYRVAELAALPNGCPHCHEIGQPGLSFCDECGSRLPEPLAQMACTRAAMPLPDSWPEGVDPPTLDQWEEAHERALDLALAWLRVNAKDRLR